MRRRRPTSFLPAEQEPSAHDANREVYGIKHTARRVVTGAALVVPDSGQHFVNVLQKSSPRNESVSPDTR